LRPGLELLEAEKALTRWSEPLNWFRRHDEYDSQ
jgi:hypothetical protein